jgi:Ser/Thr protein kinase RdoA (MazF antagonist)
MPQTTTKRTIRQKLAAISGYFGLGIVKSARRAMGTNQNYYVTTEMGRFLFKIIVNTSVEDVENGLPFLNRLEECQFAMTTYYLRAANGEAIYRSDDCNAVVLSRLPGNMPACSENVCREVGVNLAKLHLVPADNLPPKRHWLDNDYLPESITEAVQMFGTDKLKETLSVYHSFGNFRPANYPQSIIHGDLDTTNCLFVGDTISAFLDWQEVGTGACVIDFASTVLGFCFVDEAEPPNWAKFNPDLYCALYNAYMQVRPFSVAEQDAIAVAIKYVGLTQPVWSILHWHQYHPDTEMIETNTMYWKFGLDALSLPAR